MRKAGTRGPGKRILNFPAFLIHFVRDFSRLRLKQSGMPAEAIRGFLTTDDTDLTDGESSSCFVFMFSWFSDFYRRGRRGRREGN